MRQLYEKCKKVTQKTLSVNYFYFPSILFRKSVIFILSTKTKYVWVSIPVFFPLSKRSGVGEPISRENRPGGSCWRICLSPVVTVRIANPRGQNKYQKRVGTTALKMLLQHQCCIFKCNGYGDGLFVYSVRSSLEITGWRRRVRTE